jgi:xylulose-5-phosphate/fructose-6-phosphate phosphoketolase
VRVLNVVKLFALTSPAEHPHGLSDLDFDGLFTRRQVDFAGDG